MPPPPLSTIILNIELVSNEPKESASINLVFAFALAMFAKKKFVLLIRTLLLNPITSVVM